jgi:hypothetical protein
MADWWYQWPSLTIKWNIQGDENRRLQSNAMSLLQQLKHRMKLGHLTNLRAVRIFNTGSMIIAKSVFGHDFITIKSLAGFGDEEVQDICFITFINVPEVVQPMRNPGGIKIGEIEGKDYIKTYYSLTVNCSSCVPLDWIISFDFSDADATVSPDSSISTEEQNHCSFSLNDGCFEDLCSNKSSCACHSEIIEFGSDGDGTFILWKAYTEKSVYSRSGLGYTLFKAFVKKRRSNEVVCNAIDTVKVDCCEKSLLERPVTIYWEKCNFLDTSYDCGIGLCITPQTISASDLASYHDFYVLPIKLGCCVPITWRIISGPGTIKQNDSGTHAEYIPGGLPACDEAIVILAEDRCESSYLVSVVPCCKKPDYTPPSIGYTSLLMSCGSFQGLGVTGGCPPYSWSVSGGGSISVNEEDTSSASYASPPFNADCEHQPVITVKDCCGNSDSISISVNCYTANDVAYWIYGCAYVSSGGSFCDTSCSGNFMSVVSISSYRDGYNCNGVLVVDDQPLNSHVYCNPGTTNCCSLMNSDYAGLLCTCFKNPNPCCTDVGKTSCRQSTLSYYCGQLQDVRTAAMKLNGCCPIDPNTGLPM